jgi:DNA polymerase-3 subunit delta'
MSDKAESPDDAKWPPPPRENTRLLGHEAAERTVLDAWNAGRMPHAWLITGPRGIGKATFAYRVARFILAQGGGDGGASLFDDPGAGFGCDTLDLGPDHPVTQRIASGGHADIRILEPGMPHPDTGKPTRQIVVPLVRRALQFTNLTAAEGGWRVVLVDPADALNVNAQNALLKSLEEPPPNTLFLLAANAPGRLLPTIRSRCRRLTLNPLDDTTLTGLLKTYRPDIAANDRTALAGLAEGSIGDAIALADHGGLALYRRLVTIMEGIAQPDIVAIHGLGDDIARRGKEAETADVFGTLRALMNRWLARLVIAGARRDSAPEVVPGEAAVMAALLRRAPLEQWLEVWEKVTRLLDQVDSANLDPKQAVVSAFLTLAETTRAR